MKAQSDLRPQRVEVNSLTNGMAEVILAENIQELEAPQTREITLTDPETGEETTVETAPMVYEYDQYILSMQDRKGLYEDIETNFDQWLAFAKGQQTEPPQSDKERIWALEAEVEAVNATNALLDSVISEMLFEIIPNTGGEA